MKDYHLHTDFGDGKNSVDSMAEKAADGGIEEIAFTEHLSPFFSNVHRRTGIKMHIYEKDIPVYFDECREAEDKHGIKVLKGFEISYLEHDEDELKRVVDENNPDILLIAVHHLDLLEDWEKEKAGYSIYSARVFDELGRQYLDMREPYRQYHARLNRAIDARFEDYCDLVGVAHLNQLKSSTSYELEKDMPFINITLDHIIYKNFYLEVNFHYFSSEHETRPNFDVSKEYLHRGGKGLWFGSDSHTDKELARASVYYPLFEELKTNLEGVK
jgi:HisJ family histidinol phosphate phosphatase